MLTANSQETTTAQKQEWLPALIALSVIIPAVAVVVLRGRPREVSAVVFSAYGALLMALAAAVFRRKGRRTTAIALQVAAVLFAALCVTYVVLALRR